MRRQGIHISDQEEHPGECHHEDLGWNDMGYDTDPDHHATSDTENNEGVHHNLLADAIPESIPAVKLQQEEIAAKLGSKKEAVAAEKVVEDNSPTPPAPLSISREVAPLEKDSAVVKAAREHKRKATPNRPVTKSRTRRAKTAFTLRLDAERHLRLRLATAVENVSAQQLVTKAVDEYLKNIPELEELAERVPARGAA
jgi:hypothetical protein